MKWVKRRPATSALLTVLFLTVVGFSAVLARWNWQLNNSNTKLNTTNGQLNDTVGELRQTNDNLEKAKHNVTNEKIKVEKANGEILRQLNYALRGGYAAQLAQVSLLADRDPVAAMALLNDPVRCPPDLRDFTWNLLYAVCNRNLFIIPGQSGMAFAGDNVLLGLHTVGDNLHIRRFNSANGELLSELTIPGQPTFTVDHRLAAVLTPAGELHRYDLADGSEIGKWPLAGTGKGLSAFSEDLRLFATVDEEGAKLRLWDATSGRLLHTPEGLQGSVTQMQFSPNSNRLVTLERSADNPQVRVVRVWDVSEGRLLRSVADPVGDVHKVAVSPDGRLLATFGPSLTLKDASELGLYDLNTGKRLPPNRFITRDVHLLAFGADGHSLMTITREGGLISGDAGQANTIWIWDVSGAEPRALTSMRTFDASGFLSPDRRTLAVGTHDGLQLFDVLMGRAKVKSGSGTLEKLKPLAFAPDGQTLVTAGLKLWDLGSGKERLVIPNTEPVAFSPDGANW